MKIRLDFSLLEIKYTEPIIVQKKKIDKNRVLAVKIMTGTEFVGQIDFTPLSHFHNYTLEEWEYVLDDFFNEAEISFDNISFSTPYFNMVQPNTLGSLTRYTGELLFIIESILFSLIEKFSPSSLACVSNRRIKLNGLYSSSLMKAAAIPNCLKIKIRPTLNSLEDTTNIIKELLLKNPKIRFRLDGNQSFELNDLLVFMQKLETFFGPNFYKTIEYLEEPLKNHYDYFSFSKLHPYPEALDESLLEFINNLDQIKKFPPSTHLVLKPSLLGISKSLEIMNTALHSNHNVVISSAYETNSAIRPLLFLAAKNPSTYHGFDTLKFLPKQYGIYTDNYSLEF